MTRWHYDTLDVLVEYDDVIVAHDKALRDGKDAGTLTVPAEVDIGEALECATVDQLREALGREQPGYTQEQLDAIRDCFAALVNGDHRTASAMLTRVFEHAAQIAAAENGMAAEHRRAA